MSILRELMTNERVEPEIKTMYEYVVDYHWENTSVVHLKYIWDCAEGTAEGTGDTKEVL